MKTLRLIGVTAICGVGLAAVLGAARTQPVSSPPAAAPPAATPSQTAVLGFTMKLIDGSERKLEDYKGKVVVLVNVASKCGYTSQYEGLEKLYKEKKDAGLVVLAFPANNFGGQEPGSNAQIAEFCKTTYGVSFPVFEKISVKGEDQHPLYKTLTGQPDPIGGDPKWNFTKFVVDRKGKIVARFDADRKYVQTANLEPELLKKVDELLAQK